VGLNGSIKFTGYPYVFIVFLLWLFVGYSCARKRTKSGFSYIYVSQQQENIAPLEEETEISLDLSVDTGLVHFLDN